MCNGVESWGGGSTAVQLINHNGLTSAPNTVLCDFGLMRGLEGPTCVASGGRGLRYRQAVWPLPLKQVGDDLGR